MRCKILVILLGVYCCPMAQTYYLFIGTYTTGESKGIYVYRFNAGTGKAEWVSNTEGVVNPSYLDIAPDKKHIYAVTETARNNSGSVSAFAFDSSNGQLSFVNKQTSGGDNPCYVSVSKNNKWVVIGNYSGGNLSVFPVNKDGSLQPFSQSIQHTGKSVNEKRQEAPHVHSTVFSPNQDFLFTPDLGLDKVMIYKFNPDLPKPLAPAKPSFTSTEPGSGPRHFVFHPNHKFAYLVEELSGTVVAYHYNKGQLKMIQRIAAHPDDYKGAPGSADIHISPDGKFLYASNRGNENNLAIFSVDLKTGKLLSRGYQPTLGTTPRNFMIDPSGKYLLVANQSSSNIVIFERNQQTGLLKETGEQIKVPNPVCLKMM